MHDKGQNRGSDKLGILVCKHCLSLVPGTRPKYLDEWGDEWVKPHDLYVVRIRDGSIGNWQDGEGLTRISGEELSALEK